MARKASAKSGKRPINLALQGGGAHGAFTWGVLDRLLEDEDLEIEGISGTSAGAINAAVLAQGYVEDGRAGARAALHRFWHSVAGLDWLNPLDKLPVDKLAASMGFFPTPSYLFLDAASRLFSPYQVNPFNWHPLRAVLEEQVDFDGLEASPIKLFVSATTVRSGKNRVFRHDELSADALLASACLPFLFQAVEIDGEAYWDGGYMGNPAIYPLIYHCAAPDVMLVQINPIRREEVPTTAPAILDRINEISFNATLMREMRAIAFVTKLIEDKALDPQHYKKMHIHMVEGGANMSDLSVETKLTTGQAFLDELMAIGRGAAEAWLEAHRGDLGRRSSLDIAHAFL